jgi:DNA-binding Lrp family transcriptional regulator
MDACDRRIVNALQDGFPIAERPFQEVAEPLGLGEAELIERIERLCAAGLLSRFGPMFNAERLGGAVTLAAMAVPDERFDAVAAAVNAHPEVAHNYARRHRLNMWFVVAAETPDRIPAVIAEIEAETGLPVFNMPKQDEYFLGLRLTV